MANNTLEERHRPSKPKYAAVIARVPVEAVTIDNLSQKILALKEKAKLPAALVVSSDVWIAMTADLMEIELTISTEHLRDGYLGKYMGFPVYSDAYFHPATRRLPVETLRLVELEDHEVV